MQDIEAEKELLAFECVMKTWFTKELMFWHNLFWWEVRKYTENNRKCVSTRCIAYTHTYICAYIHAFIRTNMYR